MNSQDFNSSLADTLVDFIKLKQCAGYDYSSPAKLLVHFDQFLVAQSFNQKILNEQIVQSYLSSVAHRSPRSIANINGVVRLFSEWLNQHNSESYVVEKPVKRNVSNSRPAYIFSHKQIFVILNACREFSEKDERVHDMYRMLLSLLYTTGIRVGEALKLNFGDVFLEENLLHIRKGKFRKERYLILKPSMNKLLCSYLKQYQMIHSHHHEAPLFLGMRGKRLIYNSAQIHFKRVLRLSKLPERGWHGPRLHDLRHTFAVHRLLKWYETEQDINAKLPFLSTYMGHVKINSTQVYIHAVNELLQAGSERFHHLFLNGMNEGGAIQ